MEEAANAGDGMPAQQGPAPPALSEAVDPTAAAASFVAPHSQQVLPSQQVQPSPVQQQQQAPPSPAHQQQVLPAHMQQQLQQQAPSSPATAGRDRHLHTDDDVPADEEVGHEAAVVTKAEQAAEVPPEGPRAQRRMDLRMQDRVGPMMEEEGEPRHRQRDQLLTPRMMVIKRRRRRRS